MHINGKRRRYMPLIGIVARKKDIKDIKRKLGENYELSELNSESIKNLKNIKFDEIIYNKDINLTEEEYKFMREIINKTKYILINSDEKIKIYEHHLRQSLYLLLYPYHIFFSLYWSFHLRQQNSLHTLP